MKILFVNSNLSGHIHPTLQLVEDLVAQGISVTYFCSGKFEEAVTRVGAEFLNFTEDLEKFLAEYRPSDRHPFFMLMEYMLRWDEAMLPIVLGEFREKHFDALICDSIFGGADFLGKILGVPVVCSHSSFAMGQAPVPERMLVKGFHPQLDACYTVLDRICETYGITTPTLAEVFISRGDLNVVYTTKVFNGDMGLGDEYLFIGPSVRRHETADALVIPDTEKRPIVYVSLGSINTDDAAFYRMCAEAFTDSGYYVIMSIGNKFSPEDLGTLPENVLARPFVPQLEVLQRASVFVTHAGFNSVNEALSFGVPMLAIPLVNDQHMVAKRIVSLELGLSADRAVLTSGSLRDLVDQLATDKTIRENCRAFSRSMDDSRRSLATAEIADLVTSKEN
jgi:MGT family glycosyltransferase